MVEYTPFETGKATTVAPKINNPRTVRGRETTKDIPELEFDVLSIKYSVHMNTYAFQFFVCLFQQFGIAFKNLAARLSAFIFKPFVNPENLQIL